MQSRKAYSHRTTATPMRAAKNTPQEGLQDTVKRRAGMVVRLSAAPRHQEISAEGCCGQHTGVAATPRSMCPASRYRGTGRFHAQPSSSHQRRWNAHAGSRGMEECAQAEPQVERCGAECRYARQLPGASASCRGCLLKKWQQRRWQ